MWFSARVCLMVGLDDLEGLFQPKGFYDSIFRRMRNPLLLLQTSNIFHECLCTSHGPRRMKEDMDPHD